jgi:2-polyprenyl-3-methyl-5-hydroxy-6-metoxy-1,4-benzoquinol methylase
MFQYIPQNSQKVLEVGCSNGLFLDYVKQHTNCEVWGIEMNVTAAEKAAKVAHKVLSGDFNVVYTELPAHYFDCIVFNDVIEHFIDPWQALINAKSLLTEKGVIVSSIPNFRYIGNMTEIIKSADFRYREEGGILDKTHVRFFTAKSMKRLFEECGYQVIIQEGLRPCKSWKEKLFITLSCGFFNDMRFLQYAHVAAVKK